VSEDASRTSSLIPHPLFIELQCNPITKNAFVDVGMWEKIVLNLLSNSFKYTLKGGVALTLEQVNRYRIEFIDWLIDKMSVTLKRMVIQLF